MSNHAFASIGALLLLTGAAGAQVGPPVELTRWEGKARLQPLLGPGERLFRLVAEVEPLPGAPQSQQGLAVRVRLPDGRTQTHTVPPGEGPRARRVSVFVPARAVWNVMPDRLVVGATLVRESDGLPLSNELVARIDDFPTPDPGHAPPDPGPFGWGRPLDPNRAAELPRPSPAGLRFVRIPPSGSVPAFMIAQSELSNAQAAAALPNYAPPGNRSDEFALEDASQPAFGLTPARAEAVLRGLSQKDRSGIVYRLPTRDEWFRAARAGQSSAFWWGDEPSHPPGANLLGPEPALRIDTTAQVVPGDEGIGFEPNPWGLFHTFGNVAEWATVAPGKFVRMGGDFRTEPPPGDVEVARRDETGPNLFVGVRPVFSLNSDAASQIARRVLGQDARLAGITVTVDIDQMTAVLEGEVVESSLRRVADRKLAALWWLAAVEDRVVTPTLPAGQLARLGEAVGPPTAQRVLGKPLVTIPVAVRWADRLPVIGSEWYVNWIGPGNAWSYRLDPREVGGREPLPIVVDRSQFPAGVSASVFLSLGAAAASPSAPHVVSSPVTFQIP